MSRQLIPSAIFLKGFSSVIVQTLLIRELFIIFCGNELTFGITLSIWLASAAIGSAGLGSLFKAPRAPLSLFCLFQLILSLGFPLGIIFVRASRPLLGISFAGVLGLNHIIVISLLCLSLVTLDGALFAIGFRLIPSVAKIYILESCGVIIGAVAFTFILLTHLEFFFNRPSCLSVFNISCCCLFLSIRALETVSLTSSPKNSSNSIPTEKNRMSWRCSGALLQISRIHFRSGGLRLRAREGSSTRQWWHM